MSTPRAGTAVAPTRLAHPRRALATVMAVVFLDLLGFGIIIPILPFYVVSFWTPFVFGAGLLLVTLAVLVFRLHVSTAPAKAT